MVGCSAISTGMYMKDYSLSQKYAIIGLDGMDTVHSSMAKKAALHSIAAAQLLDNIFTESEEVTVPQFHEKLTHGLSKIKKMKKSDFHAIEKELTGLLEADGTLEEIPDLLSCDINYYTAGITMNVYRSQETIYKNIIESVRAEILEDGSITQDCVFLLWLFRESGCIHEIFSREEQEIIQNRMFELTIADEIYKILWQTEYHGMIENLTYHMLKGKKRLFENPFLEGVNLAYPFFERRKAIFIDFVVLGTNVRQRRLAVCTFLSEKGHYVEEVKYGEETILKIDNSYYRVFPNTISWTGIPIQGANLLPIYQ